jgi:hypothetical protein
MSPIIKPKAEKNYKHIFEALEIVQGLQSNHYVEMRKPGNAIDRSLAHFNKNSYKGYTLSFEDSTHQFYDFQDLNHLS